jgi:hypothetical protein
MENLWQKPTCIAEEASRRQAAEEEITRLKAELDRLSPAKRAI